MDTKKLFRVAEVQLSYKVVHPPNECPQIRHSKDAYNILMNLWDMETIDYLEKFLVLLLNRNNKVFGVHTLSKGGVSGTIVDTKVLFALVLKSGATGMVLSHNHPSANHSPSSADIQLTKRIKQGAELLDITLIDHIIVSRFGFYSFADEGNL